MQSIHRSEIKFKFSDNICDLGSSFSFISTPVEIFFRCLISDCTFDFLNISGSSAYLYFLPCGHCLCSASFSCGFSCLQPCLPSSPYSHFSQNEFPETHPITSFFWLHCFLDDDQTPNSEALLLANPHVHIHKRIHSQFPKCSMLFPISFILYMFFSIPLFQNILNSSSSNPTYLSRHIQVSSQKQFLVPLASVTCTVFVLP